MSGFGGTGTTHDVGDRLTWYLFQPISERRPAWQDNMVRMQTVCLECHNENFIDDFYTDADTLVETINSWVAESNDMVAPLREQGLMTKTPFDEPIDFTYFELWHHWGRTAKFGAWMQGPDYTQWHGAYEMVSDLEELQEMVNAKLAGENVSDNDRVLDGGVPDAVIVGAPTEEAAPEATAEAAPAATEEAAATEVAPAATAEP